LSTIRYKLKAKIFFDSSKFSGLGMVNKKDLKKNGGFIIKSTCSHSMRGNLSPKNFLVAEDVEVIDIRL